MMALMRIVIYGVTKDSFDMVEVSTLENRQRKREDILEMIAHINYKFHMECNNTGGTSVLGVLGNLQDTGTASMIDNKGTSVP